MKFTNRPNLLGRYASCTHVAAARKGQMHFIWVKRFFAWAFRLYWGLCMNDGHRHSFFLSQLNAKLLTEAFSVSYCLNRPLNRHVTVHWEQAGVRYKALRQQNEFIKLIGDCLRLRAAVRTGVPLPPYYASVFENPVKDDDDPRGLHSHIAIHVADEDWPDFCDFAPRQLKAVLRHTPARGVLHCELFFEWGQDDFYWCGVAGLLRYFLKGIHPSQAETWDVKEPKPQGEIIGKRVCRSESLNPTKIVWTTHACTGWPGISIAGPELRNLHLLRYAIPHALPGILA
jgi:hypothetical protein